MKSYRFDDLTGLEGLTLHEEERPRVQRGELLLRIMAVSLNYRDLAVVLGKYVWNAKAGLIPCSDAAAEIVEVGEGVFSYKVGDRVLSTFHPRWFGGRPPVTAVLDTYGNGVDGWLCEYKVVSQEAVVPLPDGISWEEGATLPCAATTAWTALHGNRATFAGESVLTLGTGGVSIFALQLAKAAGARVIATTSSDAKAERLKELGAVAVINYREIPDWAGRARALTGGVGVDHIIEVGGPATINQSFAAVRWGGDVAIIGFLSDENPGIDYFHLKATGATIRCIGVGDRDALDQVVRAVHGAEIRPVIDRIYAFDEAKAAFERLRSGAHFGKVVVRVGE
jgi:alcohol dehydrogenase